MNRMILSAVLVASLAQSVAADPATYYGFPTGVNQAPRMESLPLTQPARIARVEGSDVYALDDDGCAADVFRFGISWYVYTGTHWYRATSLSGPFRAVDVRFVPRPVLQLPPHHWKSHPLAAERGIRPRRGEDGEVASYSVRTSPIGRASLEERGPRFARGRPGHRPR